MDENTIVAQNTKEKRNKIILIAWGVLLLFSIVFGIWLRAAYLPLGCFIMAVGVLILISSGNVSGTVRLAGCVMAIAGICIFIFGISGAVQNARDMAYSKRLGTTIESLFASKNDAGTKYAAYDEQKQLFRRNMIPDEYRAESAEDIAAVVLINTDSELTGHYTSGDEARRYVVRLSIKEVASGEITNTSTVYGGNPPDSITKKTLSFGKSAHYGSMPSTSELSEESLKLIKSYREEKERKARVVLLSEEELRVLFQETILLNADADGWISVKNLISTVQKEQPDFRMSDYGYSVEEFAKANPGFEIEERKINLGVLPGLTGKETYIRWTGGDERDLFIPASFALYFNQALPLVMDTFVEEAEQGDKQEIIDYYRLHYSEAANGTVYYNNEEWSIELSGFFDVDASASAPAQSLTFSIAEQLGEQNRHLLELILALTIEMLDTKADMSEIYAYFDDPSGDRMEMDGYIITALHYDSWYMYGLVRQS